MKKLKRFLVSMMVMVSMLFMISFISVNTSDAVDCSSAVAVWKLTGNLHIKIDSGSAIASVKILQWRSMTYNQKYSLAECIRIVYKVSDVYIYSFGDTRASELLAAYRSGKNFKVYK